MRLPIGDGEWEEVEKAVGQIGLVEGEEIPRVTHGICPACQAAVEHSLTLLGDDVPAEAIELGIGLPAA